MSNHPIIERNLHYWTQRAASYSKANQGEPLERRAVPTD